MVSYTFGFKQVRIRHYVLILIVVEDGLVLLTPFNWEIANYDVLILVVVDDGLVHSQSCWS